MAMEVIVVAADVMFAKRELRLPRQDGEGFFPNEPWQRVGDSKSADVN